MPALAKIPSSSPRCGAVRGAAFSVAIVASCAGDVLRAAVIAREQVFMRFRRRGGRWALANMQPLNHPTKNQQSIAATIQKTPLDMGGN